jgi:nascent polypeptide-associated complex subunit alpha
MHFVFTRMVESDANLFPGGLNPRNMQRMMKQLGIQSEELNCSKVVFELDGKKMIIESPSVTLMEVQGQKTFTVMGEPKEETSIPLEDIDLVASTANVTKEIAEKELEKNDGDIAKAISALKK